MQEAPAWTTSAGLLGTITQGIAAHLAVTASDPNDLPLTYSLLNGSLPPGLLVNFDGTISGTMTQIAVLPNPQRFTFVMRVSNGHYAVDRQFAIDAVPLSGNPTWNNLPPKLGTPIPHYPLASVDLGAAVTISLDITDPDFDTIALTIAPIPGFTPAAGEFNGLLPPGLALNEAGQRIEGFTTFNTASAGVYFFQIEAVDMVDSIPNPGSTSPPPLVVSITLTNTVTGEFESSSEIVWVTPTGDLGSMAETYPCYFTVVAEAVAGHVPAYALAPNAGTLPPGLSIDMSGTIRGVANFVNATTRYVFTVRASVETVFVDRTFAITVTKRFTASISEFRCVMLGPPRQDWTDYYQSILPRSALFRADDPDFGIPSTTTIYIIKGIPAVSSTALLEALNGGSDDTTGEVRDVHHTKSVIIGNHNVAVVRDAGGSIVYEVLYREIIDPQAHAGGFADSDTPSRVPVFSAEGRQVFPNSFRNLRYDIVADLGLAGEPATVIGPEGIEAMPLWMTSPQTSDPASSLGYVPAIEVAYLLPGQGAVIMQQLSSMLMPGSTFTQDAFMEGALVTLDRYLLTTYDITSSSITSKFFAFPHN